MTLAPGIRLGPYDVIAQLGEGGMGQVWRARDTQLNRDVALKVLPEAFAEDGDRLARFTREAQTLAALNHPNIAQIYGIAESGSRGPEVQESAPVRALVMELVEGDDLSDRISRGAMLLDEVLPIAKQIAEALEAAHEQGIIHRDLKPANIKVRPDGTVKVLDFGLAKAMTPDSGPGSLDPANSPTLTARATQMGMILGTAAYMAPEQAKGKAVDKRADIWAFGVVLYEMVTGQRAFKGDDFTETLASVLKDTPDVSAMPSSVPPALRRLIGRCLERDVRQRLRDIGEARVLLDRIMTGAEDDASVPAVAAPLIVPAWRRALPWALAAVGVGSALVLLSLQAPWRETPASIPRKLLASIGADALLRTDYGASAILSPDGTTLAFSAVPANQARPILFVRKLNELQALALAGTEDARSPFFSPDGQWIAYFADGQLKKVSSTGGSSVTLCDAPGSRGGTWTADDTIIFTPEGNGVNARLMRVPAAGGTPSEFVPLGEGAISQRWPAALPDGRSVLYSESSSTSDWNIASLVVAPLSGETAKVVVQGGYYGRYVPAASGSLASGYLIYMNQGTLFAVPFDLDRLETVGSPVPALDGVRDGRGGSAQLGLSTDGTMVYVPGGYDSSVVPIDWLTSGGKSSVLRSDKADWGNPRFSPDGKKLAMDIWDGRQRDLWVYDIARDTITQLTFDPANEANPVWTLDGQRIVFSSDRAQAGVHNLYWMHADGTGEMARLTESPNAQRPVSWHPNGRFLTFVETGSTNLTDLMVLPMDGDATRGWTPGTATVFQSSPFNDGAGTFSPDGRFIAYTSTEAGGSQWDIYVRPFPGPGGKWRVSTTGGIYPKWSATTNELLFLNYLDPAPSKIMAASYSVTGNLFQAETAKVWSPTSIQRTSTANSSYDLHPDGRRVAAKAVEDEIETMQDKVVFFFNFAEYLAQIAPGKK